MRRFELVEGRSSKFWEIHSAGSTLKTRWGRIGTAGQGKQAKLASPKAATAAADKQIAEKLRKGYVEVTAAAKQAAPKQAAPKQAAPKAGGPKLTALQATILTIAKQLGLEKETARIEKLVLPCVKVRAKKAKAVKLGDSRFGGKPDLPKNTEWPTRKGVPMEFVAQLRLADVAAHDTGGLLPKQGSLLFFYNTQMDVSDMVGPKDRFACATVIYHPGADSGLAPAEPPRVEYKDEYRPNGVVAPYVYKLAALEFAAASSLPVPHSCFLPKKDLAALGDAYEKLEGWWCANCTYDKGVYKANKLLGHLPTMDYVDAMKTGDVLLLQVDSDSAADFQWGDCDRLYFVISAVDLKKRDFSKVRLHSILG